MQLSIFTGAKWQTDSVLFPCWFEDSSATIICSRRPVKLKVAALITTFCYAESVIAAAVMFPKNRLMFSRLNLAVGGKKSPEFLERETRGILVLCCLNHSGRAKRWDWFTTLCLPICLPEEEIRGPTPWPSSVGLCDKIDSVSGALSSVLEVSTGLSLLSDLSLKTFKRVENSVEKRESVCSLHSQAKQSLFKVSGYKLLTYSCGTADKTLTLWTWCTHFYFGNQRYPY